MTNSRALGVARARTSCPLPAQEAEEVGAFTAATPVTATRTRATARYSSRSTG